MLTSAHGPVAVGFICLAPLPHRCIDQLGVQQICAHGCMLHVAVLAGGETPEEVQAHRTILADILRPFHLPTNAGYDFAAEAAAFSSQGQTAQTLRHFNRYTNECA